MHSHGVDEPEIRKFAVKYPKVELKVEKQLDKLNC
jgi:hypothetical protein